MRHEDWRELFSLGLGVLHDADGARVGGVCAREHCRKFLVIFYDAVMD